MKKADKQLSFWKRVMVSIKDFDHYSEFAAEQSSKAIRYFITLIAIFTLFVTIVTAVKFTSAIKETFAQIDSKVENFTFTEGVLEVSQTEPITIEGNEFIGTIIIDTADNDNTQALEERRQQGNTILITKDSVVLQNKMADASISYSLKDIANQLPKQEFTKADFMNFVNGANIYTVYIMVYVMVYFYLFLIYLSTTIVDLIVLAIIGYITSRIIGVRLRFAATCKIAVYSLTLPIVLNLVYIIINAFTGFTIKYFQVMYVAVSYIYMITAILLMKSDFLKRQEELTRAVETQRKLHSEMEQEEEEQNEENEKEEEEEGKESAEKEGNVGNEPEGNHA